MAGEAKIICHTLYGKKTCLWKAGYVYRSKGVGMATLSDFLATVAIQILTNIRPDIIHIIIRIAFSTTMTLKYFFLITNYY